jgi:aspartate racemase
MMIAHADVDRVLALAGTNDLDGFAQYLASVITDLKAGGAELTAMVAITPHICVPQLVQLSPLPFIDIVAEVGGAVREGAEACRHLLALDRLRSSDVEIPRRLIL